jgi:hypothetical protein
MRNIKIYTTLFLALSILPQITFAQTNYPNLFYNNGDQVFIQSGAILHVQGDVVNNNVTGQANKITNNGVLNVEGDFNNTTSNFVYGSSGERTVRFIGNSTNAGSANPSTTIQTISGSISTSRTASFYNLVIDRGAVGQVVMLNTNVNVDGSLVWNGASTETSTYNTGGAYSSTTLSSANLDVRGGSTPPSNGIVQTYNGSGTDFELYVTNGSYDAVSGFKNPTWGIGSNTEDQSVRTRGAQGSGLGGLSREVWQTAQYYVYPLSTSTHTYNPVKFNFATLTSSSSNKIRGMFCDATSAVGTIGKSVSTNSDFTGVPAGSIPTTSTIDNNGYNLYYDNPCNIGHRNWIILDNLPTNGGYWSFADGGGTGNTYHVELYPNDMTFTAATIAKNNVRALRYHTGQTSYSTVPSSDIASIPSGDWGAEMELVQNVPADLISYTGYTSGSPACSANFTTGIPGGMYAGFSHFQVSGGSATNGNALPVKLIALSADPIDNQYIRVNWATASEQDNKGFEVQRSLDGQNFTTVGWVDGNGTTEEQHNYLYDDHTVQPNTIYYYRLNQLDVDGNATLTYVVSASITDGPGITVSELSPNPTSGSTRLVISTTEAQSVSVKFYDILGKLIMSSDNNQISIGTNTLDFDMGSLADATYTAIIRIGGQVYSKKIVLVK